jgi:hypothetical protein
VATRTGRSTRASRGVGLSDPLVERYLTFVEARARHNTLLATASDLRVFFGVVEKRPAEVTPQDVLGFITAQRRGHGDGRVVRLVDRRGGVVGPDDQASAVVGVGAVFVSGVVR